MAKSIEQDIINGGKTIPYKVIKEHPEAEKEFIRKNKNGHQFPTIQKYACGEYCVRSVLSMYGKDYMDVDIADEDGVEIPEMTKRLNKSGIGVRIKEKATYENIQPKAIVYYPKEDHWVAVEDIDVRKIIIHDSNYKDTKKYTRQTFEGKWLEGGTGYIANTFKQEKNIL
jgi:predicted double-glycine peptidase